MTNGEVSNKFEGKVDLGIIGGTGLYHLDCLKPIAKLDPIVTPWGVTSSPITIAKYILKEEDNIKSDSKSVERDFYVAFLSRHGLNHEYPPSRVPFRANIAALKHLNCRAVISFSAVGSLRKEIKPRDFILPQQIIDRTKGIRESSYFNDIGLVGHVGFGDPFSFNIANFINDLVKESFSVDSILINQDTNEPCDLHFNRDMTVVCMEGPQFSTRAESKMYRMLGGDIINMSVLPEAKLARECELPYQMICMSTDYDAWMDHEEPVSVESVIGHLNNNGRNANRLASKIIENMAKSNPKFLNNGDGLTGSIKMSISTKPDAMSKETLEKLRFLFPDYW